MNVASAKGCIPYLKKLLGHPVEWNVCLLHGNELPFRALFALYVGKTSGPHSFQRPLGKELQGDLTNLQRWWFISKAARRGGCRAQPWPRVFVWYVQVSQQGDTYWQRGILWARKPLPFKLGYPSKSHIAKVSHHSKWLKSTEKACLWNHSVLYPYLVLDQIPPTQQDQHECNKLPWSDWLGTKFSKPSLMRKSKDSLKSLFHCVKSHEHEICLITGAATSVIDPEARDGFIRHKLKLQRDIGSCNTKKEFFPVLKKDTSQEWKVRVNCLAPHLSFKSYFPLFCSDC